LNFVNAINPLYSLSGLIVGLLVGVTGVGGGSLMTPLLVLLFGVHPATAVGTDLLYAAITKSAGTIVHGSKKTINWQLVGLLCTGSIPAALITLYFVHGVDRNSIAAINTITISLGYMLLITAVLLLFRNIIVDFVDDYRKHHAPVKRRTIATLTVILGLVLGCLVTLTSVGAGAIGVTVLLALYPRLQIHQIVGSDIIHAVPLTLVAGIGYWWIGEIDWALLASLLIGSVPGIILGSHLASRMQESIVRRILAVILILVGMKLIWG
jgi:uncharacterized protein